jgi:tetratricopeptide (TPR) repeat protein
MEHLLASDIMPPRLESAFLVTDTGMLLARHERESSGIDSDVFTGMLTAVTEFIKDSLNKMGHLVEGDVSRISHGNFNVITVHGRSSFLASVVSGRDNELLIDDMVSTLGEIERNYGEKIRDWSGDFRDVAGSDAVLKKLFESGKYEGIDWTKDDPKARQSNTFENITLGISRIARTQPVLLYIDDLQWADPLTLSLLHYLSRNTRGVKVFIVGTYRAEDILEPVHGKGHPLTDTMQLMGREDLLEKLELKNLRREEVAVLVREHLGKVENEKEFVDLVHRESEGNPLFVIELLDLMKEERILVKKEDAWCATRELKGIDVPSKIHDLISRRLSRLDKEQRQTLEAASVIGDAFSSELLIKVSGTKRLDLLRMLNDVEKTHRLVQSMEKGYRFTHVKIREVLYGGVSDELRREYHAIVGDSVLEIYGESEETTVELAYHYYMARRADKAIPRLMKAVEIEKRRYSNEEVLRFCNYAIEMMTGEGWQADKDMALECLGDSLDVLGMYDDAVNAYRKALGSISGNEPKARLHRKIGSVLAKKGEYEKSLVELDAGKGLVQKERTPELGRLLSAMGFVIERRGDYDGALIYQTKAREVFKHFELAGKDSSDSLNRLGTICLMKGDLDEALGYYESSLKMREKVDDLQGIGSSLMNIGNVYNEKGEYDRALEQYERALRLRERVGDRQGIASLYSNIGTVLFNHKCDYAKALEHHEKALRLRERMGDQQGIGISLNNIGNVHHEKGEYEKALAFYERSLNIRLRIGNRRGAALSLVNIGELYAERGEDDRALEHFRNGLSIAELLGDRTVQVEALCGMAEVLLRKGNAEEARTKASTALEMAKARGSKVKEAVALRILAMQGASSGDQGRANEGFERALSLLKEVSGGKELPITHFEYGKALKKWGDEQRARKEMERAYEGFISMNLHHKAERVLDQMKGG